MRTHIALWILAVLAVSACSSPPAAHTYSLQGQVLAVTPDLSRQRSNREIKGFMGAMTMSQDEGCAAVGRHRADDLINDARRGD
jgi:hypothetical protein